MIQITVSLTIGFNQSENTVSKGKKYAGEGKSVNLIDLQKKSTITQRKSLEKIQTNGSRRKKYEKKKYILSDREKKNGKHHETIVFSDLNRRAVYHLLHTITAVTVVFFIK